MNVIKPLALLSIFSTVLYTNNLAAEQFEISLLAGQMYSSDLIDTNDNDVNVDSGTNIAIGIGWPKGNNGQGQVLINRVSHDFDYNNGANEGAVDITYAHFNGIALFRQQNYVTTFSLGLGGAHFDAEQGDSELYPSASIAIGTRYEFSDTMALVTELRAYATLVDEKDNLFCKTDTCTVGFDDSLWVNSTISIGFAMKF